MATATGHRSAAYGTAAPVTGTGGLLAVVGAAGPDRTALLLGLGDRLRQGAARRRAALVRAHGASAPDPYDRVGELLDLAAVQAGLRVGAVRVGEALTAAGLTLADHPDPARPGTLPRGARYERLPAADQLLLATALALIPGPGLLLVDTDTDTDTDTAAGTDAGTAAGPDTAAAADPRVWHGLRRIAATGVAVIATATDATLAGDHADRVVLLPHTGP
ncbi:hypothetical protein ABZ901_07025 [Actinacidiphila alni]|uniref:hypothetical protein n=1 Tax=Actinacidiphila alni TaxID=380248 RepID=UPI0033DCF786